MCNGKISIDIKEIYELLHQGDKTLISDKLKELYANYNTYRKSSQFIIDRVFELAMDILRKE